jgi:hypothetical protein
MNATAAAIEMRIVPSFLSLVAAARREPENNESKSCGNELSCPLPNDVIQQQLCFAIRPVVLVFDMTSSGVVDVFGKPSSSYTAVPNEILNEDVVGM